MTAKTTAQRQALRKKQAQTALRVAAYRQRNKAKGGQTVCVWAWSEDQAKVIRALADNLNRTQQEE